MEAMPEVVTVVCPCYRMVSRRGYLVGSSCYAFSKSSFPVGEYLVMW